MKEIVVISGKGGTGKTTVTSALAAFLRKKVIVDADVDAPDLHMLLKPEIERKNEFYGMKRAKIDLDLCVSCNRCIEVCRFDAISPDFVVDPFSCDGCGVCPRVCPTDAIEMLDTIAGHWFISRTRYGPMIHALLEIGEENSGKLVAILRHQAKFIAEGQGYPYVLVDGPPGAGCPVISSLTGAHYGVAVTEPTLSGWHDLERILSLMERFRVKPFVIINKYDLNRELSLKIKNQLKEKNVDVIGEIPFDEAVVDSIIHARNPVENGDSPAKRELIKIYERLMSKIES